MNRIAKIILIISVVCCLVGVATVFMLRSSHTANCDTEPARINLPQDSEYDDMLDSLYTHNVLVRHTIATWEFDFMAHIMHLDKHVRPGSYLVTRNMNMLKLVRKLRNGQQDPIRLTIGKFRTPQQLNDYLNQKLMHNDFSITLDSFYLIRPNTYEFYWTVTPHALMKRMEQEYNRFWDKRNLNTLKILKNPRELVVLASIVEEETNNNAEKPLIASVYLNRIRRGMPLQADPTVKYAVGDFSLRRILQKHLSADSPFNTYQHAGLPPAPICLPSEASVDAVLNAPETTYLYFCANETLDGTHRFASTLAEHNRNAARFHAALNRRGIK